MFSRQTASPREFRKWCAYALLLLMPGSMLVLPLLWLFRRNGGPAVRFS